HHGHEQKGLPILEQFCSRLRIPNTLKSLSAHVMRYHTHCHKIFELKASTLTDMLYKLGAFKSSNSIVNDFAISCEADAKGRTGLENKPYPQSDYLLAAAKAGNTINTSEILNSSLKGAQIGEAIRQLRIKAIADFIKSE
ncbi:MAG: multifunctional CCA tRNA nucleotidyl transferase/2'3'-cyclic phosphodiesterase/2'nucleotidase/phosphatase, partial [Methylococcales bacterium]|nr:multifunctional CCA tRNA nucleotidyl transferase/2'3'-cyclic phosphodiesterase/2'nucleotidase/phosphatase [Methylococcales bacterium]